MKGRIHQSKAGTYELHDCNDTFICEPFRNHFLRIPVVQSISSPATVSLIDIRTGSTRCHARIERLPVVVILVLCWGGSGNRGCLAEQEREQAQSQQVCPYRFRSPLRSGRYRPVTGDAIQFRFLRLPRAGRVDPEHIWFVDTTVLTDNNAAIGHHNEIIRISDCVFRINRR